MGVRAEGNKTRFNCRGDAYHLQWECEPRAIKLVLIAEAMPTICKVSEKKCSFCVKTELFRLWGNYCGKKSADTGPFAVHSFIQPPLLSTSPWPAPTIVSTTAQRPFLVFAFLLFTVNPLIRIVKIFPIMHKYTFSVFRQRARTFWPSVVCLYARRGGGGDEKRHFQTTRKPSFFCSRWSLES